MNDRELVREWWDEAWTEGLWAAAWARLAETQRRIGDALADPGLSEEHFGALAHFVAHDCYHFGQINMVRGKLGMGAIE